MVVVVIRKESHSERSECPAIESGTHIANFPWVVVSVSGIESRTVAFIMSARIRFLDGATRDEADQEKANQRVSENIHSVIVPVGSFPILC